MHISILRIRFLVPDFPLLKKVFFYEFLIMKWDNNPALVYSHLPLPAYTYTDYISILFPCIYFQVR
jgi:hypothetical protein